MIGRMIVSLIFLGFLARPCVGRTEVIVPVIQGRVYADGSPIKRLVEVRLEAADSSPVASAVTLDPPRFQFQNVRLDIEKPHYLVIREAGYKELRYELRGDDFRQDADNTEIARFGGIIMLELQSLAPAKKVEESLKAGSSGVDVRQLQAGIPGKARREYGSALEDIEAGKSKLALEHLEKAVRLAPEYYEALNQLGVEYVKSGQYWKAETTLERACAINPNDPFPLINLGVLHFTEGEALASAASGAAGAAAESYRKAVDALEKALRLNPQAPSASFYLGTALYKTGAYERAESMLVNALALNGEMHQARLALLNIYTRLGRYKEALQQISMYLDAKPDAPNREQLMAIRTKIETALSQ